MPLYPMVCGSCDYRYEELLNYSDEVPKKCPKCKKNKLEKDWGQYCPRIVDNDHTTIGAYAERNTARLGGESGIRQAEEDKQFKQGKIRKKRDKPFWDSGNDLTKIIGDKKKEKAYIEEGKL